jgi:hypothetical protein
MPLTEISERLGTGLKVKFAVMIGAFLIINTVILSGILIYKTTVLLEDELKDKGILIARRVASDSLQGVLIGDFSILDSIMKDIKNDPDIVCGIILDNQKKVLAHTNIEERGMIFTDVENKKVLRSKEESGVSFEDVSIGGEVYSGKGGRVWRGEREFNFSTPIYCNDQVIIERGNGKNNEDLPVRRKFDRRCNSVYCNIFLFFGRLYI